MNAPLPELPASHPAQTDEVGTALRAIYNWSYEPEIDALRTLYANALERQWIAVRDLDWQRGVDREAFSETFSLGGLPGRADAHSGSRSRRRRAGRWRGARPASCSRTSCTASRAR